MHIDAFIFLKIIAQIHLSMFDTNSSVTKVICKEFKSSHKSPEVLL